jgi:hypothetical protein
MDATDKYLKGLTEKEWNEHEKIEAELNALVREGFTERSAMAFVVTVQAIRKTVPSATVEGIFDAALIRGLDEVLTSLTAETQPARKSPPKRKTKKSGVRLVTT